MVMSGSHSLCCLWFSHTPMTYWSRAGFRVFRFLLKGNRHLFFGLFWICLGEIRLDASSCTRHQPKGNRRVPRSKADTGALFFFGNDLGCLFGMKKGRGGGESVPEITKTRGSFGEIIPTSLLWSVKHCSSSPITKPHPVEKTPHPVRSSCRPF